MLNHHHVPQGTIPFLVCPDTDLLPTKQGLFQYIENNKTDLLKKLQEHGAVLFRGFQLKTPTDFEGVAKSFTPGLKNNYLGTSPRNKLTDFVYTASEFPPHYPVMQHCEMSFLPNMPRYIFFFCKQEALKGGETPLCDGRLVYNGLTENMRSEFATKGLTFTRNYGSPEQKKKSVFELKPWDELFLTRVKSEVEKKCLDSGTTYHWLTKGRLRLYNHTTSFKQQPETGKWAWCNHLLSFHVRGALTEYKNIATYFPDKRAKKYYNRLKLLTWYQEKMRKPEQRPMHAQFGDGAEIPNQYIEFIQQLVWQNMYCLKWQKGDCVVIDNFTTSHGRLPYYGEREILVAWS